MATLRRLFFALMCIIPGLLTGCGKPEFETATGTVTFDDQPVPQGNITFQPSDPKYGPDAGVIVDGKFTVKVRPGSRKVVIRATKLVPGELGPMGEDLYKDYIPAKYNDDTILTADVSSGGKNEFAFRLKSN